MSVHAIEELKEAEASAKQMILNAEQQRSLSKQSVEERIQKHKESLVEEEEQKIKALQESIDKKLRALEAPILAESDEFEQKLTETSRRNFDKAVQMIVDKVVM